MTDGSNVGMQKLSIRTKLGYSAGALEEAMVLAAAAVTIIFYNQVMGLSLELCGTGFRPGILGRRTI